jgi:hypothetical protein
LKPKQLQKLYTQEKANASLAYSIMLNINTMLIVKVLKVYVDRQTVDVQPVIMGVIRDDNGAKTTTTPLGEDVRVSNIELPAILDVPICYHRAGTAMITLPIQVGDTGMLIIAQRDISNWKQNGGVVEQAQASLFDINDGVFVPFVPNQANKISDYSSTNLEIRFGDDKISMDGLGNINITATTVKVTGLSEGGTLKADNGKSGDYYVATSSGASPTKKLTFTDGILTGA